MGSGVQGDNVRGGEQAAGLTVPASGTAPVGQALPSRHSAVPAPRPSGEARLVVRTLLSARLPGGLTGLVWESR